MKKHELKELAASTQRQAARWEAMYEAAQTKNEELQRINSELNRQLREERLKLLRYGVGQDSITFTIDPTVYNIRPDFSLMHEDEADPMERLTND
jgi:hypothetical protein